MDMHDVVDQLLHEKSSQVARLTKGCGSCRRFIHRLRKRPDLQIGWDDVPQPLLERFSARLHHGLFWYQGDH